MLKSQLVSGDLTINSNVYIFDVPHIVIKVCYNAFKKENILNQNRGATYEFLND